MPQAMLKIGCCRPPFSPPARMMRSNQLLFGRKPAGCGVNQAGGSSTTGRWLGQTGRRAMGAGSARLAAARKRRRRPGLRPRGCRHPAAPATPGSSVPARRSRQARGKRRQVLPGHEMRVQAFIKWRWCGCAVGRAAVGRWQAGARVMPGRQPRGVHRCAGGGRKGRQSSCRHGQATAGRPSAPATAVSAPQRDAELLSVRDMLYVFFQRRHHRRCRNRIRHILPVQVSLLRPPSFLLG